MKIHSPIRHCSATAKRLALSVAIAGSILASGFATNSAHAHRVDPALSGGISILVHRFDEEAEPIPVADLNQTEENSVVFLPSDDAPVVQPPAVDATPAEIAPADEAPAPTAFVIVPGTHDSIPTSTIDLSPVDEASSSEDEEAGTLTLAEAAPTAPATRVSRTSSDFNEMLAAVAASTAAKIGIPLEHFLEPFAMIRTQAKLPPVAGELDPSVNEEVADNAALAQAVALNRWWLDDAPLVRDDQQILQSHVVNQTLRLNKPEPKFTIDVREELAALAAEEPLDVTSHPVIVPLVAKHDFAKPEKVVKVADEDPLVGSGPVIVTLEEAYLPYDLAEEDLPAAEQPTQLAKISPDCLMDEAVWQISRAADVAECFSPQDIGGLLADLERRRTGLQSIAIKEMAQDLASAWAQPVAIMLVDGQPVPQPIPDEAPNESKLINTMLVDGVEIPAPVPDATPDELPSSEIDGLMLVDGDLVPTPVPDAVPDAEESAPAPPMMIVDGGLIPAPTPDGIPNGIVSFNTLTGIESIVAVDIVPETAYPVMIPLLGPEAFENETQVATRPEEDAVQR
ncbi:hypothetical protein LOC71_01020 [Rhodopirellula sp. JC740]|uniref:Secreted protein n=1 Tax=Rhodopirellula halodulae TaxID=2894198 RepID=A0ABS8NBN9_9BACT|nr:hypothetical protein [Rhodopirellula sp. JC740]MCC9640839.1 hypothetical protein [Rhodopirellula sp. JC740]